VHSYGIWDLVYRYLLPDWWIIPVYTTITAWIATVGWWRRARRHGRASAERVQAALRDGPTVRRYAVRGALALPFLLVPAVLVAGWYLVGCAVWAELHDGQPTLAPNGLNLFALGYATVGVVVIAWAHGDAERFLASALWYGAVVGIPWGVVALVNGVFTLLEVLTDLVFATPQWGELGEAVVILAVAAVPSVTFLAAGWLARRGYELLRGRVGP
jgi:hypothetical protein